MHDAPRVASSIGERPPPPAPELRRHAMTAACNDRSGV
jgi:hypothetical protein